MNNNISTDKITIDLKKLGSKFLRKWWLFAICFAIAYGISIFYLRYSTFQYSARAILLIKDAGRSGTISEQSFLLADGILSRGNKAMDNEIQILKSVSMMEKVVDRLGLTVTYYRQGNVKESELYSKTPFVLDSFELNYKSNFGHNFYLELKDYNSFIFKEHDENEEGLRCNFGIPFETPSGRFLINLSDKNAIVAGSYRLNITPCTSHAASIRSELSVQRIGSQHASSVLELSILDPVAEKARDVVNTLIEVYNEEEIKDENKVFQNTLEFIDKRIESLVYELDSVEGGIQRYKSANEIISENAASSMDYTLGEIRGSVKEISDFEVKKNLLESLEQILTEENELFELIPVNLVSETPVLSSLVNDYNGLVIKDQKLSSTASKQNPVRADLIYRMGNLKSLILKTILNLKKDLEIPISKIERNIDDLKRSMRSVPRIEKQLIEQVRMQEVKENLFLYLLQKREETALSEAVTTAKTRTIDPARLSRSPVYPRKKMIKASSLLLGFLLPSIFLVLQSLFETKVDSQETIEGLTSIPILGKLGFNKTKDQIVVKQGNRSAINEMFRLLRTNLNFLSHHKEKQVILVTSSISGEGKTFVALNLGLALAISDKKVVILGLDLRKPKLGSYLDSSPNAKGISNYLVGQASLAEILQVSKENKNLSFVTSGPIPPNPAELIMQPKMEGLLEELKKDFDYILIDTPPIGLVSDALLLRQKVQKILVIVRHNLTRKFMVRNLEEMNAKGELDKANIVFNGVKKSRGYYGYGGYKYGSSKGYYVNE